MTDKEKELAKRVSNVTGIPVEKVVRLGLNSIIEALLEVIE